MATGTWLVTTASWLRPLLGSVFLLAAVSKLRDPVGFSTVLGALGIERPLLVKSLRVSVPLAEAGLGIWLLSGWQPTGSAGTTVVAMMFLTMVLLVLRWRGYTGSCGCFAGHDNGVGALTITRNVILLLLAIWASFGSYVGPGSKVVTPASWEPLPLLAVVALALVISGTVVTPSRAANAGANVAEVVVSAADTVRHTEVTDLQGASVVLGRPTSDAQLIVFAKGKCPGCRRDRDILNSLSMPSPAVEAVIVCGGDLGETMEFAAGVEPPVRVAADPRWQAAIAWQVTTTPFSVLVDHDGHVRARGDLASALSLLFPQIESRPRSHGPAL